MRRVLAVLCCATACASAQTRRSNLPYRIEVPHSLLTITADHGTDRGELPILARLAAEALPVLQRWGGLHVPTRITVVSDHAELERRSGRIRVPWLRGWARYDRVYLQSPSSWPGVFRPSEKQLQVILTHELTHCVMYQAASDGEGWNKLAIPFWFSEGMASWTAGEGDRRYPVADLHQVLLEHPELDPLRQASDLSRDNQQLSYSASHRAFEQLVSRGDQRVVTLLEGILGGQSFERAFAIAYGETEDEFEDQVLASWRSYPAMARPPAARDSSHLRL